MNRQNMPKESSRNFIIGCVCVTIMLLILLCGCGGVKYVPVETVRTDSIYKVKIERDSIHVHDSIYMEVVSKADTVYKTKYVQKVVYRDALRVDTLYIEKVDSVQVPYPIEKKLTRWQQFKLDIGGMAFGAILVFILSAVIVWIIRRRD